MKKILVALTIILVIILSTGCKAENPKETINSNSATLPTFSIPIDEESDAREPVKNSEPSASAQSSEEPTVETSTEPLTTEEPKTEMLTTEVEPTTEIEETLPPEPTYTFQDFDGYVMYVKASVNIRSLPSIQGNIVATREMNEELWITGRCNETGWYRVEIEGQIFYVSDDYLSKEKVVVVKTTQPQTQVQPTVPKAEGFVYYTVAGQRPNYDYELYLYNCLADRGIAWWYPYAVAQIWQESCWNPNSTNGRDHGICQFKGESFQARAIHHAGLYNADIWNPYDSLYVYSFYIRDILVAVNWDVNSALAYYITGTFGMKHDDYVSRVWGWYNALRTE